MNETQPIIPRGVFMMDGGLATFKAASAEEAMAKVDALMDRLGGKCMDTQETLHTYSFSTAFRHRYIQARVGQRSDGDFTATFREGNASTELRHYLLLFGTLLVMGVIAWWMHSWWSTLPCLAVIALYVYLNYAPERASLRRVKRILTELQA